MSYILEALKKAQAERQLGATPTIHAPQLHEVGAGKAAAPGRPRWLVPGLLLAVAVAAALALAWRVFSPAGAVRSDAGPAAISAAPPATPAARSLPEPPVATIAVPATAPAAPTPVPVAAPAAMPAPVAPAVPPVTSSAPSRPVVQAAPQPQPVASPAAVAATATPAASATPATAVNAAPVANTAAAPPVAVAAAAPPSLPAAPPDDSVGALRDLPDPIQRQIPPVAIGGYIYSKNPADRLLLIDKILRHEGEELAPGLVLEKLLPKAAIFNFRGYRYRVPYY